MRGIRGRGRGIKNGCESSAGPRTRRDGSNVHRVLNHAHAINEKIEQLNALWPNVVGAYDDAVERQIREPDVLVAHYTAVVNRGEWKAPKIT